MPDSQYSLVVAMLTAGGLVGALSASYFSDRYGRRQTLLGTNGLLGLGSLIMSFAVSPNGLMLGRFIAGIGGGVVTVVVPAYIAECVPKASRGFFGTLNQLAIVFGILVAQAVSMIWSTPTTWRYILALGVILSVVQWCLLPWCVESPRRLFSLPDKGRQRAKEALLRLRGVSEDAVEEEMNTWRREQSQEEDTLLRPASVNVYQFLTQSRYRYPLCLLLLLQLTQQLSGINGVICYSTSIMSTVFPESSDKITLFISIINLGMTLVSAYLMDNAGRRTLFLISCGLMAGMSVLLGWSIHNGHELTSAGAIIAFVASFAVGLGAIPFLMIPEIVETSAVSSAASVALGVNMMTNFTVSAGFLWLKESMEKGHVFYVFAAFLAVLGCIAFWILPETKGRSVEEVIQSKWSIYASDYQPIHSSPHQSA
ncbi:general substrate transporter [Spinellus fusiger]|nr:general substrate transporter [Spinellus fusiger]